MIGQKIIPHCLMASSFHPLIRVKMPPQHVVEMFRFPEELLALTISFVVNSIVIPQGPQS
jgi:hypothetical protein